MNQGDLVLLKVPFTDLSSTKVRPAVVVSNDLLNSGEDLVLVPVTSVIKDVPYSVLLEQTHLEQGNLIVSSRVRADKPFTAHKLLVQFKIGRLKKAVLDEVKKELFKV